MNEFMGLCWARCANLIRLQPQRLLYVHVFSEFCHSHAASSAGTRINSSHHRLLKEIVPALHHFEGCLPRTHLGDAPARDCTV